MSEEQSEQEAKDTPEGAIGPEDLVHPPAPEEGSEVDDDSDVDEDLKAVALEVRQGKYGVGQERRKNLQDAGYDVQEVEAEVTRQLNQ